MPLRKKEMMKSCINNWKEGVYMPKREIGVIFGG